MKSNEDDRLTVQVAIELLPPRVQRDLLDDVEFVRQWQIPTAVTLRIGSNGPSFTRDDFFGAVRRAIDDQGTATPIADQSGLEWLLLANKQKECISYSLSNKDTIYCLEDHSALAAEVSVRVGWFERVAPSLLMDSNSRIRWSNRLLQSALTYDEFSELVEDIELAPGGIYRRLVDSFGQLTIDVANLVPSNRHYYERFIGVAESGQSSAAYFNASLRPRINGHLNDSGILGFKHALLMCSSGEVSSYIKTDRLDRNELTRLYGWLAERGDPISRVAAVEVALSRLDTYPELGPFVHQMVEGILSVESDADGSDIALLCAMIIASISELARRQTLGGVQPFYLRQAAITHASLILRAINSAQIEVESVIRRVQTLGFGDVYFLRGLIDLRREPRWLPDFVDPRQLRFEFIGRIMNAANRNQEKIELESLRALLIGPESKLAQAASWPFPYLPGPMEGAIASGNPLPGEIQRTATDALNTERLSSKAFAPLINCALLFDIDKEMSGLAAAALRRVTYSVENSSDDENSISFLIGLATLAGVTRCEDLASALRILVRVLRRRKRFGGASDEELFVAMVASAAFEVPEAWAQFAGDWLTEIAFEIKDKGGARVLLSKLRCLIKLEPVLAKYLASADAALDAYCS